jgi:large subunit ribosomal protein L23
MKLLLKPIVNERFAKLNEQGIYGFVVDKAANKIEIKKEVEQVFGVNVQSVRTANVLGKMKTKATKGKYVSGRKPSYKKATVVLAQGETLDFYSGI